MEQGLLEADSFSPSQFTGILPNPDVHQYAAKCLPQIYISITHPRSIYEQLLSVRILRQIYVNPFPVQTSCALSRRLARVVGNVGRSLNTLIVETNLKVWVKCACAFVVL
jgi:hypothetical protein